MIESADHDRAAVEAAYESDTLVTRVYITPTNTQFHVELKCLLTHL